MNYYKKVAKRLAIFIFTLISIYIVFKLSIFYVPFLIAFIITMIYLIRSLFVKYNEQFILTRASEKITDGYLIFTTNGKITNYNKAILKAFNFKRRELNNKNIYDIFKGKSFDEKYINQIIDACREIKKTNETIRFEIRKDDRIFKIEVKSIVNNDIFLRYVIVCKDITQTYKVIEELQNNQDMMANREKFATLGQLISRNSSFFKITNICYFWSIRGN